MARGRYAALHADPNLQGHSFKDRSAKERVATEEQTLAERLTASELRSSTLTRHREIGPFVVEYPSLEASLIVELAPSGPSGLWPGCVLR